MGRTCTRRKKPRMGKMEKAMKRYITEEEPTSTSPINNGTKMQPF
jgi:hypothetical protein